VAIFETKAAFQPAAWAIIADRGSAHGGCAAELGAHRRRASVVNNEGSLSKI
jgi:hypothetical protein